ncbi:MAG TPA: hypothetical protein PKC60_01305 [Hydrogenophaga sp.]|uniref:hypothetical protein n=1 Tax=Hydrogenophaga sp. TaxID=1904254 RepID=UPI002BF70EEF|nr:hypothetical protein [Hydrogenophaga sp.]HMN91843.1 hypothetical protein [Hydrogenophaga sp.]HMP09017.1 hypothetical protein [Hydrogenophaga sp.]
MATPNYGYEKRQRELAKKQKKEEKLRAKSARRQGADGEPSQVDSEDAPTAENPNDRPDADPVG